VNAILPTPSSQLISGKRQAAFAQASEFFSFQGSQEAPRPLML
jgi:hypothetical protein